MKNCALAMLLMFLFLLSATAAIAAVTALPPAKGTVVGKMKRDKMIVTIQPKDDVPHSFLLDDLKDTTPEFRKCVDDGKYKGVVEITSMVQDYVHSAGIELNKDATCKRK